MNTIKIKLIILVALTFVSFTACSKNVRKTTLNDLRFIKACAENNLELAKKLQKEKININASNQDGNTALILAAKNKNYEIVKFLIESGAEINYFQKDIKKQRIIKKYEDYLNFSEDFVNKKPSPNIYYHEYKACIFYNNMGNSAFTWACKNKDMKIINLLLKSNANINQQDENQKTPLFYAIENKNYDLVEYLLKAGANPNICINYQDDGNKGDVIMSPLYLAVYQKNKALIALLLKHKAKINQVCYPRRYIKHSRFFKSSALSLTVLNNDLKLTAYLIKQKADINFQSHIHIYYQDTTPLMIAASEGYFEMVKLLLKHKAKLNAVNDENKTALLFAMKESRKKIISYLLSRKDLKLKFSKNTSYYDYFGFYLGSKLENIIEKKWVEQNGPIIISSNSSSDDDYSSGGSSNSKGFFHDLGKAGTLFLFKLPIVIIKSLLGSSHSKKRRHRHR